MPCSTEQDISNFFISKSKDVEDVNISEARAWLLSGRSMIPKNFSLQLESYLLEKRQRNVEGCARCFERLFDIFPMEVTEEVDEMTNAVKAVALSSTVAETEDEVFLNRVFKSLPVAMQMDVLMHRSQHAPVLLDKCQSVLLMVKLFPDVINTHGSNMLYTLSACDESDVHSPFRRNLVTELVPTVLRLCQNLQPSPALITLLNQCLEFYVLNDSINAENDDERWNKLHEIVDKIGGRLKWNIAPFFGDSGASNPEKMYKSLVASIQRRNLYSPTEIAYIAVILFVQCVVCYYDKLSTSSWKFGDRCKLTLVEVFVPPVPSDRNSPAESSLPVITTLSPCSNCDTPYLLQYFITATKIWQLVETLSGDPIAKEFFAILSEMPTLNFEEWNVFQVFEYDFKTYTGSHNPGKQSTTESSSLKLASKFCGLGNFKTAAEYAIKVIQEASVPTTPPSTTSSSGDSPSAESKINLFSRTRSISGSVGGPLSLNKPTNFSFFNSSSYSIDSGSGFFVPQRRVHFISENKSEVISYAINILIHCFQSRMDAAITQNDDCSIGHLMTLLQYEWYSPPADMLLCQIMESIRQKGSFKYFPYFADYIIEGDILEHFMAIANNHSKQVSLDIFSNGGSTNSSSARRVGTRGVDRGAKNDFKALMQRQILKSGHENLETLLVKFITHNKVDIINSL